MRPKSGNAIKLIDNPLEGKQGGELTGCATAAGLKKCVYQTGGDAPPEKLWAVIAPKRTSRRGGCRRFWGADNSDLVGAASGFALKAQ